MMEGSKVPAGQKILIAQGAHGEPGGNALCNNGQITGNEILYNLRALSLDHPVAAFIHSCYSGDLIQKK